MDMHRAIVESSNVYFYSLANELGVDAMHDFMKPLGFGQITGIDIHGEVRGVLPSQDWKRKLLQTPGAAEDGTPVKPSRWASARATTASPCCSWRRPPRSWPTTASSTQPHLVHGDPGRQHPGQRAGSPPARRKPGLTSRNTWTSFAARMVGVTQEGTSTRVFAGAGYLSGGKTGTAQAVSLGKNEKYNAAKMEEHQRDHALYMAFAPADDPKDCAGGDCGKRRLWRDLSRADCAARVRLLAAGPVPERGRPGCRAARAQAAAPIGKPRCRRGALAARLGGCRAGGGDRFSTPRPRQPALIDHRGGFSAGRRHSRS